MTIFNIYLIHHFILIYHSFHSFITIQSVLIIILRFNIQFTSNLLLALLHILPFNTSFNTYLLLYLTVIWNIILCSFNSCLLRFITFIYCHLLHLPCLPFITIYYIVYHIIIIIRNLGHLLPFIPIITNGVLHLLKFIPYILFIPGQTCRCLTMQVFSAQGTRSCRHLAYIFKGMEKDHYKKKMLITF